MGEAKRKREARERLRGRDFTTGCEVVGRFAEVTPTELLEQLDHPTKSGCNVPCNACDCVSPQETLRR